VPGCELALSAGPSADDPTCDRGDDLHPRRAAADDPSQPVKWKLWPSVPSQDRSTHGTWVGSPNTSPITKRRTLTTLSASRSRCRSRRDAAIRRALTAPPAWPLPDTRSRVLALVDTTAFSWESVPVIAGCGLARAYVDGGLGWGRAWRTGCSFLAKQQVGAGGRGAGLAPRPRGATLTTPIREKQSCARRWQDDSFVAQAVTLDLLPLQTSKDQKEKSDLAI
jgi:hypothetical protein